MKDTKSFFADQELIRIRSRTEQIIHNLIKVIAFITINR